MSRRDFIDRRGMVTLAATSPLEILREQNPDAIPADAPPPAANYRPADVQGIVCAGCSKFVFTGEVESGDGPIPVGYCDQWEANVRGDYVSDAFADPNPALDENGEEDWDFADNQRVFAEVHLAGTDVREESGFVIKEVLRTGEWPVIPTRGGQLSKPLRIVRNGKSDAKQGIIALAELVENFKAGAISQPQIPLSDDSDDHKNITRVNTGFVRDLWIVDEDDQSKLVAKMEFTEPEVREKVLRGTYADVSCGIPWAVQSRGKVFGASVEHVAITNRPFIDGLGPFLAASDKNSDEVEVVAFGEGQADQESDQLGDEEIISAANSALRDQLALSTDYSVANRDGDRLFVRHSYAGTTWSVPFKIDQSAVRLSQVVDWKLEEIEEEKDEPPSRSTVLSGLEKARRLREIRLSQKKITTKREKEGHMPLTREELDRLELSDDARAEIQNILDENAALRATTREAEADRRVEELKDLGLSERPGFLKFYRSVFLSDDGGPATVLLSDNGTKENLTAQQILDRALDALKGSDGKLALSDQHLVSGNDDPPPANAEGEIKKSDEERIAEAKRELGLDRK